MSSDAWAARAATVAEHVMDAYGHRLAGLPGTWIGRVALPGTRPRPAWVDWNYWWQAHFVDCLVDAAHREWHLASEPPSAPPRSLRLAQRVIRTIRLRNFGRFENMFFDDMAWLALAASRADRLSREIGLGGLPPAARAAEVLGRRLVSGDTLDAGGGMFWNTKRQYKNTAATGPAALFFARSDVPRDRIRAQALVDWLFENLVDPASGLLVDGVHLRRDGSGYLTTTVNHDIWTYNQGPVLGALLELGGAGPGTEPDASNIDRAERLIAAIAAGLTSAEASDGGAAAARTSDGGAAAARGSSGRALRSDGDGGDHGLFRGILARYLALAAVNPILPAGARETAKGLVLATAEQVWAAEVSVPETLAVPETSAPETQLSSRLQAWMVLEAAAVVASAPDPARDAGIDSAPDAGIDSAPDAGAGGSGA
ncbi:glycoside hydrolase family 76 protein [Sinomonas albida]|uniref:glycoside hydrolase family 76 protein n=1 Tax=Sinomonas albida TaxID=369942 RepID=UPI00301ADFD5